MTNYDFEALSSNNFEEFVRDVLNADLGLRLMSFPEGRDRGIDLRQITDDGAVTVVQCKHYAKSGYSTLLSKCRKEEVDKAVALNATRYLLVTSVSMPAEKRDKLRKLFTDQGVRLADRDLWTHDDLNAALGRNPNIEQQHYKLWLGSATMLQAILSNESRQRNHGMLERAQRRQQRWVSIPEYSTARERLTQSGICVIAGDPGAGKSMLAERLVFDALREGWEVEFLSGEFSGAWSAYRRDGSRQLFFFDDMLGETRLRQGVADESEEIEAFAQQVHMRKDVKRLIVTSRVATLTAAIESDSDKLPRVVSRLLADEVRLDSRREGVRREMLLAHIDFSDLPDTEKEHLTADDQFIGEVVRHPAFNPRLIEVVTGSVLADQNADSVRTSLIQALRNPGQVWAKSFHVLSAVSQDVLLTLATLPTGAWPEADIRALVQTESTRAVDWEHALKLIRPTWLLLGERSGKLHVTLANPACREYLESLLDQPSVAMQEIQRIGRLEQLVTLTQVSGLPWRDPATQATPRRPHLAHALTSQRQHLSQLTQEFGVAALSAPTSFWEKASTSVDCARLLALYGTPPETHWLLNTIHDLLGDASPTSDAFRALEIGQAALMLPVDASSMQARDDVVRKLVDAAVGAMPSIDNTRHLAYYEHFPQEWFTAAQRLTVHENAHRILKAELTHAIDTAEDSADGEYLERHAHALQEHAAWHGLELDLSAALAHADHLMAC